MSKPEKTEPQHTTQTLLANPGEKILIGTRPNSRAVRVKSIRSSRLVELEFIDFKQVVIPELWSKSAPLLY